VTTQVGCNIGCTFCASGLIKKQRDLNNGEIVAQIMLVQKYFDERGQDERVSHIVVMGIGEHILYIYEGHREWEGSKGEVMSAENERLNSFIFASDLFRKIKESQFE